MRGMYDNSSCSSGSKFSNLKRFVIIRSVYESIYVYVNGNNG